MRAKSVRNVAILGVAALAGGAMARANNLVINPTFASNITSDANAVAIEAGINAAIARVESYIANPVTVAITFQEGGGLGGSSTYIGSVSYPTYANVLNLNQTHSADDNIAIASLPGSVSAVNGNSGAQVVTTLALFRALGFTANPPVGQPDSTITLNTSIMNISRTGAQNGSFYDLQAVVAHEMDEVLGVGGPGTELGQGGSNIGPEDLFRFSAPGVRSYTTSSAATAYFSINGGTTNLVGFNQSGGGADYADWVSSATHRVQDAFGSPGIDLNLGVAEVTALDVVGWNLTPAGLALETGSSVPEPASLGVMVVGAFALLRRRAAK